MLVATAGHIDHGKTALLRALTGVETDRLPEERARGISIDLGFAYWTPAPGETIGFVNVPGHHRFVRNMLAGIGGIDFALIVIAADDGVMPQTVEHVQILDLLGIERAAVAITKCDRAERGRIDAVRAQAEALLAPTSLAGASLFELSSTTGVGVDELGGALLAAHRATLPRCSQSRNFRLAIDRAFTVTGVGTVVTGTVLEGSVEIGTRLTVSPRGEEVRVRGLQSAGRPVERVAAGERCALNLAGIDVAAVHRGDWLVVPEMHSPSLRVQARLKVIPGKSEPLTHYTPVHLHLGTADLPARVLIAGQGRIAPGEEGLVQLALDQRTSAVSGDRFVLRDQSGRELVGGGTIVDPFVSRDRRKHAGRAAVSQAMQHSDPRDALAVLLAIEGHEVDAIRFERCFNLDPATAREIYAALGVVQLGKTRPLAFAAARIETVAKEIAALLADFHRDQPEAGGMAARELRPRLATPVSADAFAALLKDLAEKRLVELAGNLVRLPGHEAAFSPAETKLWNDVLSWAEETGALVLSVGELLTETRSSEASLRALLYRRRVNGELWRMAEDRFLMREHVAALAASAAEIAGKGEGQGFTAAQFRDATGIGRNAVIRILEFLDTIGVTARRGDARILRRDYQDLVGIAEPYRREIEPNRRNSSDPERKGRAATGRR